MKEKKKVLIVVDMQNDFITGTLGTIEAQAIVPAVKAKVKQYIEDGGIIIFTRDTHREDYLGTQEGRKLPHPHCVLHTEGREIVSGLYRDACYVHDKSTFGSLTLLDEIRKCMPGADIDSVELAGLCTDICVVSNALILKAQLPETEITVDEACCAGVTPQSHRAALLTMKMCQINIIGGDGSNA